MVAIVAVENKKTDGWGRRLKTALLNDSKREASGEAIAWFARDNASVRASWQVSMSKNVATCEKTAREKRIALRLYPRFPKLKSQGNLSWRHLEKSLPLPNTLRLGGRS